MTLKLNIVRDADALSRRPGDVTNCDSKITQGICCGVFLTTGWDHDSAHKAQHADPILAPLMRWLSTGIKQRPPGKEVVGLPRETKSLWFQWDQLLLKGGLLYRRSQFKNRSVTLQLVVPTGLQKEVLKQSHDTRIGGHLGQKRTLRKVQKSYYWVGYRHIVDMWVRSCLKCQARKMPKHKYKAALQLAPTGAPFERIALDIMGPLPVTSNGNIYVLVVMDYFTKWAEAYALPDQQAKTVARVLVTQFVCRYGVPNQIHSDQGSNFESKLFSSLCKLLEIDKTRTTAYHPQSDGLVERFNRTLQTMLSMYCKKDQSDWDQHLPYVLMAYRASQQETTGATPNSLVFGREINLPVDILAGPIPDARVQPQLYAMEVKTRLENAFEVARQHADGEQRRQKKRYDTRMHGSPYKLGDSVWLYCPAKYIGLSPKLRSHWQGPCKIL